LVRCLEMRSARPEGWELFSVEENTKALTTATVPLHLLLSIGRATLARQLAHGAGEAPSLARRRAASARPCVTRSVPQQMGSAPR
jgi:hypothetical protein